MPAISETGRPTRSSFQGPAKGLSLYAPFTHFFVNCCYSVAYLTPDEARDPGFTIIVSMPTPRLCRIRHNRHTFAVRALESSPTSRQRIGQHMVALATYLVHVNINATYWYLEATPELLRDIGVVAETFT